MTTGEVTLLTIQKCEGCGGVGRRLVVVGGSLCAHCKRLTQSNRTQRDARANVKSGSAVAAAYAINGFVDITPGLDGGLLKARSPIQRGNNTDEAEMKALAIAKATSCGSEMGSSAKPWSHALVDGCPCGVHFVSRWAAVTLGRGPDSHALVIGGGDVVASSRDVVDGKHVGGTDDVVSFVLGRGEVVAGIEWGVRTMALGEKSVFLLRDDYAFGSRGDGFKVGPAHVPLEIEVELVYACAPLPLLPKGPELEKRRKERQKRERMMNAAAAGPLDERLACSNENRSLGNELVRSKQYEAAKAKYDAGFLDLVITNDEWEGTAVEEDDDDEADGGVSVDDDGASTEGEKQSGRGRKRGGMSRADKRRVAEAKALLHVNRSLVNLKLGRLDAAKWDAERALDCDRIACTNKEQPNFSAAKGKGVDECASSSTAVVPKALYRKGLALLAMSKAELAKELPSPNGSETSGGGEKKPKQYWDVAKAQKLVRNSMKAFEDAEAALIATTSQHEDEENRGATGHAREKQSGVQSKAAAALDVAEASVGPPNLTAREERRDKETASSTETVGSAELVAVRKSKADAQRVAAKLAKCESAHDEAWRSVCRDKIMAGLEAENSSNALRGGDDDGDDRGHDAANVPTSATSTEATVDEALNEDLADMPELDDDDDNDDDDDGEDGSGHDE